MSHLLLVGSVQLTSDLFVIKNISIMLKLYVGMAEWSKAPDSSDVLVLSQDQRILVFERRRGFKSHF